MSALTTGKSLGRSIVKISVIGIDIAKSVFHLYAVNENGKLVKKTCLKRSQLLPFFARIDSCTVAMEACSGSNHWAREFRNLGHEVKLIAPQYVKPFVKGNKNDYNDAEAITEAAQRPSMRFVPIKSIVQQDIQSLHRLRERVIKARTALVNQIRGLLSEYGIVMPLNISSVRRELPRILEDADNSLTPISRGCFAELFGELQDLDGRYRLYEQKILEINKQNDVCQRLNEILGVGPMIATAVFVAAGQGEDFRNGRHFSSWLGLVPRQHSSGGKSTLLGISKRGNAYIRTLLIHGARAVLRVSTNKGDRLSRWAQELLERRGHNRACVAIANKLARIIWVIMARNERYRLAGI